MYLLSCYQHVCFGVALEAGISGKNNHPLFDHNLIYSKAILMLIWWMMFFAQAGFPCPAMRRIASNSKLYTYISLEFLGWYVVGYLLKLICLRPDFELNSTVQESVEVKILDLTTDGDDDVFDQLPLHITSTNFRWTHQHKRSLIDMVCRY